MVDVARQQGRDLAAASLQYKKTFPRYGDPARWNPSEKFNEGLRQVDADVYPEFATRIDAWRNRTPNTQVELLVEKHGTLNALVRHLISSNAL